MNARFLVAGLVLITASVAAFAGDGAAPWVRVHDPAHGFSLSYPPDWKPKPMFGDAAALRIAGEIGGCAVRAASVRPSSTGLTVEQLRPHLLQAFAPELLTPGATLRILSSGDKEIHNARGVEVVFEWTSSMRGGFVTREKLVAVARENEAFAIRCTAPSDRFDELLEEFDGVIASLRWTNAPGAPLVESTPKPPKPGMPIPAAPSYLPMQVGGWVATYLVCAPILGFWARRRNRNPWTWGLLGGLGGPLAILLLFAKPPLCWLCGQPHGTGCRLCKAAAEPPAESVAAEEEEPPVSPPAKAGWVDLLEPFSIFAEVRGDDAAFVECKVPFWKSAAFRSNRQLPIVGVEFSRDTWELRAMVGGLQPPNPIPSTGLTVAELFQTLESHRESAAHCRLVFSDTLELTPGEIERKLKKEGSQWDGPPLDSLDPAEPLSYTLDLPFSELRIRRNRSRRRMVFSAVVQ